MSRVLNPINHTTVKFRGNRIYKVGEGLWPPDDDPYNEIVGYIVRGINENGFPDGNEWDRHPFIRIGLVNIYGGPVTNATYVPHLYYENGIAYFTLRADRVFATRDFIIPVTKPVTEKLRDYEALREFDGKYKYEPYYMPDDDDYDRPFLEHATGPPRA